MILKLIIDFVIFGMEPEAITWKMQCEMGDIKGKE